MFAIAFDLVVDELQARHPKSVPAAYSDVARVLKKVGFRRIQGSVFVADSPSLAVVTEAMVALKGIEWFPPCVKDIRAFKVQDWSDFTSFVRGQ
jgi:virulence-associated protein VapD